MSSLGKMLGRALIEGRERKRLADEYLLWVIDLESLTATAQRHIAASKRMTVGELLEWARDEKARRSNQPRLRLVETDETEPEPTIN